MVTEALKIILTVVCSRNMIDNCDFLPHGCFKNKSDNILSRVHNVLKYMQGLKFCRCLCQQCTQKNHCLAVTSLRHHMRGEMYGIVGGSQLRQCTQSSRMHMYTVVFVLRLGCYPHTPLCDKPNGPQVPQGASKEKPDFDQDTRRKVSHRCVVTRRRKGAQRGRLQ